MLDADKLLPGTWLTFRNLTAETTEQDVQQVIANRTGVVFEMDRITITRNGGRFGDLTGAIVSVDGPHLAAIMKWALSDDTINGQPCETAYLGKANRYQKAT